MIVKAPPPDFFKRAIEDVLYVQVRGILANAATTPGADRDMIVRAMLRAITAFAAEERTPAEVAQALRALAEELER